MKYLAFSLLALPLLVSCDEFQEVYYNPPVTYVRPSVRVSEPQIHTHVEVSPRPAPRVIVRNPTEVRRNTVIVAPRASSNPYGHGQRVVVTNSGAPQTQANVHVRNERPTTPNQTNQSRVIVGGGSSVQEQSNAHGHR